MNRNAVRRIEILNYVLGGVATLVALVICSRAETLGLFIGALIGALNFSAIAMAVRSQFDAARSGTGRGSILILPKMLGLIAAVFASVLLLPLSVPFFAIGFSIFFFSIAVETIRFLTSPGTSLGTSPGTTPSQGGHSNG